MLKEVLLGKTGMRGMIGKMRVTGMLRALGLALSLAAVSISAAASDQNASKIQEGALNGVAYSLNGVVRGYNEDLYFRPASTEKVITALAALSYLGPNYQIKTRLLISSKALSSSNKIVTQNGVLNGDIEIEFRGDPFFTKQELYNLLNTLKDAGVRTISGNVYLNSGYFAGHDYATGWSWDDLPKCFTAPPSSIIINGNCVSAKLSATKIGGPVSVEIPEGMPISVIASDVEVVSPSEYYGGCELEMDRNSQNIYRLSGCIPVQQKGKPLGLSFAIQDPEQWGKDLTAQVLNKLKIQVNGKIEPVRKSAGTLSHYAAHHSKPIVAMLDKCLKRSVNLIADSIARTIGTEFYKRPATYDMSLTAIRRILKGKGIDLGSATLIDGSGLSPHNYITPRQMLTVLQYIADNDRHLNMIKLFPVAGQSGTLGSRGSVMKPPLLKNVTAKTGTLNGVSNLAGFLTSKNGKLIPFVYFMNNLSYDDVTKRKLATKKIAKPHYAHERRILEAIYNEETVRENR